MIIPVFNKAYKQTKAHEGGYVNRADDRGGETYKGISRRWFPDWIGWATVDSVTDKDFLVDIIALSDMVEHFYLVEFWDKIRGYSLRDQDLANLLFDTAVHTGAPDANKFLQGSLNFCNRNEDIFKDLKVDGLLGPVSLAALDIMVERGEVWAVTGYALMLRAEATVIDLRINPEQEHNAVGWIKRLISFNKQG